MDQDTERHVHTTLGAHGAQIDALNVVVGRMHQDMTSIINELKGINKTLNTARGGVMTLLSVATASSAATAGILKIVGWLH